MDFGALALAFVLGAASTLAALAVGRRRVTGMPGRAVAATAGDEIARRLRRIDATEAYLSASVDWLLDRAVGNRTALAAFDTHLVGVPFGQVEVRLLPHAVALEYAALCRWLWSHETDPVGPAEAVDRARAFRIRLHAALERQRALAERGAPAEVQGTDVAESVGRILDEVLTYRAEQVRQGTGTPA